MTEHLGDQTESIYFSRNKCQKPIQPKRRKQGGW